MLIRGLLVIILLVIGYFFIRRWRRSPQGQRWLRLLARLSRILWTGQRSPATVRSPGSMSREEAYAILGLPMGASRDEIQIAYRRLIQRVHPDQGGSADLAARLNQARDVLLG